MTYKRMYLQEANAWYWDCLPCRVVSHNSLCIMAILTGRKFDFRVVDIGVPTICHLQFNDLFVEALYILSVAGSLCNYFISVMR